MVTAYQHQEIQYWPTQYEVLQTWQNLKINNLIFSPKCLSFYAIIKEKSIKHSWEVLKEHSFHRFIYYHYTFRIKLILQSLSRHHFVLCRWNILICQMHSLFMNLSTMLPRFIARREVKWFLQVYIYVCIFFAFKLCMFELSSDFAFSLWIVTYMENVNAYMLPLTQRYHAWSYIQWTTVVYSGG